MNDNEFLYIKRLINDGVKVNWIHQMSGRSREVIRQIRMCNTLTEMREKLAQRQQMQTAKKPISAGFVEPEKRVTIIDTPVPYMVIADKLEKINETLEKLVEAWNQKPKGIFGR